MAKIIEIRLSIFLIPFLVWFIWREIARRLGRPGRPTPWFWLVVWGAMLTALTLVFSAVFPAGPDTGTYVPGEVRADGAVSRGHFVPRAAAPRSESAGR